ncbi:hypothetical protein AMTR_s00072p00165840 [Amborella trichopoda]|uniref:Uncharacterized protein n=1 Tax=Amborella trichopoda TaxID=13333 RepID=W1NUY8_AMBTC|nr:hypothetical protein AMTR_s00072p00165840 [Amborella trichopoda]
MEEKMGATGRAETRWQAGGGREDGWRREVAAAEGSVTEVRELQVVEQQGGKDGGERVADDGAA